jgi:hypothetical protein
MEIATTATKRTFINAPLAQKLRHAIFASKRFGVKSATAHFKTGHCVFQIRPLVVKTGQYPGMQKEHIAN